jgi:hypothetical protein
MHGVSGFTLESFTYYFTKEYEKYDADDAYADQCSMLTRDRPDSETGFFTMKSLIG